jgi:hypothetical protein
VPEVSTDNIGSLSSIELIKEKRQLLKRVVLITRATERMQDSLNSVLILGKPSTNIPEGVLKYYHILSNKIKQKPTEKISWYLETLEELIKTNLQGIVELTLEEHEVSSSAPSDQVEAGYSDEAMRLLNEFKRQSQTAVALKILLQQRGVYTSGAKIKESVQQIEGHIERLERREEKQRKQLRTQISEMHADLSSMLKSDQYSDDMKKVFRKVMADLENDQKAVDKGERIDKLQLSFEVVETGVDKKEAEATVQLQVTEETEEYLEDFYQNEMSATSFTKVGFLKILYRWLNTPWSVTWGDIRKRRKNK